MLRFHLPAVWLGAAACLTGALVAQQPSSIVFTTSLDEIALDGGAGLERLRLAATDKAMIVTPTPAGSYSARTFLSVDAQWAFLGDIDQDSSGTQVDTSSRGPGGDIDAIMVKRVPAPTGFGVRDLFFSYENSGGSTSADLPSGFEDGDVFRFAAQGQVEVFVSEALMLTAFGQSSTSDIDIDAICQSDAGDLFVSVDLTENVNGVSADDGAIIYIPATAITYDSNGDVVSFAPGAASVIATESDVIQMALDSGFKSSVGGDVTSSFELSGLDIDPNGGTWNPPGNPSLTLPNLLFTWSDFSNDGAILSTASNGTSLGSIPVINGVPMASTVATFGTQLGLLPDSTGLQGLGGLALIPAAVRPQPTAELYPTNVLTSSSIRWSQIQLSNATPNGLVAVFVTAGPSGTPGNFHPATSIPGLGGELFGDLNTYILLGGMVPDTNGLGAYTQVLPPITGLGGFELVFQGYDLVANTFVTPAPMRVL